MLDEVYDSFLTRPLPTEPLLRRLFSLGAPLVIFDVGACEGEDSIRYARLFTQARVFAFEPLPANQQLIRSHFARHQMSRCELVPVALSDRAGEAILHVSSGVPENKCFGEDWNYGNKSSSLLPPALVTNEYPWLKFEQTERVRSERLDDFCRQRNLERVDFLHLDVQGAESLVLQGAADMLPGIKAVWLEVAEREVYAGQKLRGDIGRLMRGHGFRLAEEDRRGLEGDQFYVNLRFPECRQVFRVSLLKRIFRKGVRLLARLLPRSN